MLPEIIEFFVLFCLSLVITVEYFLTRFCKVKIASDIKVHPSPSVRS